MQDIKYRFSIRRYIANWVIITLLLVAGASYGLGKDSTDESGSSDLLFGFGQLVSSFGGIFSFWAIIVFVVTIGGIGFGIYKMCKTDFTDHNGRVIACIAGGLVVVAFAAWMGIEWIDMPSGTGWMALLGLLVPTLLAFRHAKVAELVALEEETIITEPVSAEA